MIKRRYDDDDDERRHGRVLRDGERVRIPMAFRDSRDSWRDDMAAHFAALQTIDADARRAALDGSRARFHDGRGWAAGFRPGSIIAREPLVNDPREAAYAEIAARDASAWSTAPTRDATGELRGAQEGDSCTLLRSGGSDEGPPGHMQMINGVLTCVADPPQGDSRPHMSQISPTDAALALRAWEDENLWRGQDWINQNRPAEFRR